MFASAFQYVTGDSGRVSSRTDRMDSTPHIETLTAHARSCSSQAIHSEKLLGLHGKGALHNQFRHNTILIGLSQVQSNSILKICGKFPSIKVL